MPIGDVLNGELYFVAKDGTEWSTLGTVTDMEILEAPGNVPEAHITTILREPIEFSAALDTDTEELWRTLCRLVGIDRLLPYQEELLRQCMNKKEETHMKMSEKMALRLHLMMWSDMQKELGDNPSGDERVDYKHEWVKENFPCLNVDSNCWLCEYTIENVGSRYCDHCPIVWGTDKSSCDLLNKVSYLSSPISDILALPARNPELQYIVDSFNAKSEYVDKIKHDSYNQGRIDADKEYDRFKQWLAVESGIEATEGMVRHAEALRKQGYEQAAKDFAEQLDAAFKRGLDEAMEKILKGEIQSDTSKKLEKQAFNRACEDICKEAGVQTSYTTYGLVSRIKEVGWSECKKHIINHCNITGADYKDFTSDILARYKNQVTEETLKTYFVDHPQAKYWCEHDVDQAFRQYAKEKTDPIKKALSEASGKIKEAPVSEHIDAIKKKVEYEAYKKGCFEQRNADRRSLSVYSELPDATNHWIHEHAKAIYDKGAADARKTMEQKFQDLFKK